MYRVRALVWWRVVKCVFIFTQFLFFLRLFYYIFYFIDTRNNLIVASVHPLSLFFFLLLLTSYFRVITVLLAGLFRFFLFWEKKNQESVGNSPVSIQTYNRIMR